jgi:excisionase family DNA binding protein
MGIKLTVRSRPRTSRKTKLIRMLASHPISAISYQEHLLTIYDAADRLRVHRSCIYELINTGVLPHPIKLERAARFKASDLDKAIGALSKEHAQ